MPVYEFRCPTCGNATYTTDREQNLSCRLCSPGKAMKRVWGFSFHRPFQAGFNPTFGKPISNRAQLEAELSKASDIASAPRIVHDHDGQPHEVPGIPTRLVPVDVRDKEALGVTEQGLDSTYNHLKRIGNDQAADRLMKAIGS
jgi:hypothetical protein